MKAFKYLGSILIIIWCILCAFLFYCDYALCGTFMMFIIYDAMRDLIKDYERELILEYRKLRNNRKGV